MSDQIVLNAETRERTGSNKARVIRKVDGMVPAIVYGDEKESLNLKLHLNELTKASQNELFYTQVLLIKNGDLEEKVVLKELQRDPAKGKFLHADFQRVSRKTKLKVIIPMNFINEEECVGVKNDGGLITKAIREVEIMCLAGNIPESIDVDVTDLELGASIRLTEVSLPEGSEIPGLTEETDQMVVSVNAPKAVEEEEPILEDGEEGEEGVAEEDELEEAYNTIRSLKATINEVNLLNAKLLFSNKLFRSNDLNESQKMKVIETFDRANSVREVKLVYSTLSESLTAYTPKRKTRVTEVFASKTSKSTAPKKGMIVESNDFANRMKKLAGLL